MGGMVSWSEFESQAPELAQTVRTVLDKHKHKVMATLRKDGSPRVSGTEVEFRDGELWLGSMSNALKALDLRRDPRMALHNSSDDADESNPSSWSGDAKLAGRAVEIIDQETGDGSHRFRVDLAEVVWTRVDSDQLVIDMWHEGKGVRQVRRA